MLRLICVVFACWAIAAAGCGNSRSSDQASSPPAPRESSDPGGANAAPNKSSASGDSPAAGDGVDPDTSPDVSGNPSTQPVKTEPKSPARSNTVHEITFDDLNCGMQADIVFRPWMLTERVQELDGQQVRIAGYMHPDAKQKGITEFVLLRNTECKFGPAGQADHLIRVTLTPGVTTSFSLSPVEVTGTLSVNPFTGPDGNTWSIFDMKGMEVGTPRRRPPEMKENR